MSCINCTPFLFIYTRVHLLLLQLLLYYCTYQIARTPQYNSVRTVVYTVVHPEAHRTHTSCSVLFVIFKL